MPMILRMDRNYIQRMFFGPLCLGSTWTTTLLVIFAKEHKLGYLEILFLFRKALLSYWTAEFLRYASHGKWKISGVKELMDRGTNLD